MICTVALLSLLSLALAPVEAARTAQHAGHPNQAVNRVPHGHFSTVGPHSQKGHHMQRSMFPQISNKANLVRVGKKEDLTIALERPYQALFGQIGVNKHNYRSDVYGALHGFNTTVVGH
ncbi:Uncharacterized protein PECH_000125 [Penicillium ucsense]|uniref:Secreted protein n=1 Tax=Penicillium ucsense TaxID=2839758 RepID=A0A8J8W5S4_9EURO|nr:Uncharacterized protein PECM_005764 [Penicillium ucsense]KAF7739605.1 Uncharacterized protein PECH_000125 [Penicillium ucsense]